MIYTCTYFLIPLNAGWWFQTCFIFPYSGNVIIPTNDLIFFRGVGQPPTSAFAIEIDTKKVANPHHS